MCLFSKIKSPRTVKETKRIFTLIYALGDRVLYIFCFLFSGWRLCTLRCLPPRLFRRECCDVAESPVGIAALHDARLEHSAVGPMGRSACVPYLLLLHFPLENEKEMAYLKALWAFKKCNLECWSLLT